MQNTSELDVFQGHESLGNTLDGLLDLADNPDKFLTPSDEYLRAAGNASKGLYDYATMSTEDSLASKLNFKVLHVSGFDAEQVWAQIDPFSKLINKRTKNLMKRISANSRLLTEATEKDIDRLLTGTNRDGSEESLSEDETASSPNDSSESEDVGGDISEQSAGDAASSPHASQERALLPVEDDFFHLDTMEKFVEEAEHQVPNENANDELGEFDYKSDEELYEYLFAADTRDPNMSDDDRGSESPMRQGHEIRYDDFFVKQPQANQTKSKARKPDLSKSEAVHFEEVIVPAQVTNTQQQPVSGDDPSTRIISNQELQALTLSKQIEKLEESALADKPWPLRGEISAVQRPLNSALEMDLDFDTTVRPPPEPTEESTHTLEELIKQRIADHKYDDVIRVVPPPIDKKRKLIELDDSKAKQGLGEVYETEYVRTLTGGGVVDKDEGLRSEAKKLFAELSSSLDALTHFQFAPKPVIEEMDIKVNVPAIAMEESLPIGVSEANVRAPQDVYRSSAKGGDIHGDTEKTHQERKRLRKQFKRQFKNKVKQAQEDRMQTAVSEGGEAALAGRKSLKQTKKKTKAARASQGVDYGNSRSVFAALQEERDNTKPGEKLKRRGNKPKSGSTAQLKL